ncbi:putative YkwD family protein [Anaerosolibacter carboniphilus]|uniref:Putative YkwD family protein n=1 Tax=Anaerosolibacter carboniphilus TaxID=1417629 RepID=A0A841KTJ3_9FIRM|nr:CAP domain-containing protein [Anaerosolibacter carboniphilus]MBB6217024.1 putative YkwD family protein [Anaerosolibacter carboniphilus]
MKKIYILILAIGMIFSACSPTVEPQQKPTTPQQGATKQQQNKKVQDQDRETQESSIFEVGEVRNCRITTESAPVKAGAGNNFNTVATLNRDDVVKVLDQVGSWYVIQLDNNQVGAIEGTNATPIVKEGENKELPKAQQPQTIKQNQTNQLPKQAAQQPQQNQRTQNNVQATPNATTAKLGSQEQQMVDLVNRERTKNGLSALTVDSEVARVAGIKAQDMVDKDYFSHYSPTYGSPFDMMKNFGIEYLTAGENLAGNSSVEKAHEALMNSSGHRQNILSPDFTHIGIGVRPSEKYGYIYTQMFIGKRK